MRLNPKKCVFRVKSSKFLGFMINSRWIKAYPDQVHTDLNLKRHCNFREVQCSVFVLGCFMSKSADQCQPFLLLYFAVSE